MRQDLPLAIFLFIPYTKIIWKSIPTICRPNFVGEAIFKYILFLYPAKGVNL